MNCPSCNQNIDPNQAYCSYCGSKNETRSSYHTKQRFCNQCGQEVSKGDTRCLHCGETLRDSQSKATAAAVYTGSVANPKSKLAAGLFGIFLGGLGIHNFYLGYTGKAIAQLLLSTIGWMIIIGPIIAGIWGLIEGILILTGDINKDAAGHPLRD